MEQGVWILNTRIFAFVSPELAVQCLRRLIENKTLRPTLT